MFVSALIVALVTGCKTPGYKVQAISKMKITFKDKARADEKVQHTWEYVSILPKQQTAKQFAAFIV